MPVSVVAGRSVLFAGPTIGSIGPELIEAAGFEVLPPARRGDISDLSTEPPGRIVLVDGLFHQFLAVGHMELRSALETGWDVWGLSSMGAIRAFEMRAFGMKGYGKVYEHFLAEEDFQDDEVALLHAPEWPFESVSEPLVHLRHFLASLERDSVLRADDATAVVAQLKSVWYGYRTLDRTNELIRQFAGSAAADIAAEIAQVFSPFRIKTHDVSRFLSQAIWTQDTYEPVPSAAPYSRY